MLKLSHIVAYYLLTLGAMAHADETLELSSKAYYGDNYNAAYTQAIKDIRSQALQVGDRVVQMREKLGTDGDIATTLSTLTDINVQLSNIREKVVKGGLVITATVNITPLDYELKLKNDRLKVKLSALKEQQRKVNEKNNLVSQLESTRVVILRNISLAEEFDINTTEENLLLHQVEQKIRSLQKTR